MLMARIAVFKARSMTVPTFFVGSTACSSDSARSLPTTARTTRPRSDWARTLASTRSSCSTCDVRSSCSVQQLAPTRRRSNRHVLNTEDFNNSLIMISPRSCRTALKRHRNGAARLGFDSTGCGAVARHVLPHPHIPRRDGGAVEEEAATRTRRGTKTLRGARET